MFLYVIRKSLLETIGAFQDMLVVHAYDANGEEHGRETFKWVLDIPGAVDQTGITDLEGVTKLQRTPSTLSLGMTHHLREISSMLTDSI